MQPSLSLERNPNILSPLPEDEASVSAVSWPAIFSGSFVTVAFMFVFFLLGSGLGLAAAASFHERPKSLTYMTTAWLIITQWLSSGMGGYITGRLRTKWIGVHTHEVFFRDTAHGLLTWAVATVFYTALILFASSTVVATTETTITTDASSAASVALYTSLSMFIGAFIASVSAALGGMRRDESYPPL